MRSVYEERIGEAREIEGRLLLSRDRIVPLPRWIKFARDCWPSKTAAELAALGKRDERTAKRWLSGEIEPPQAVTVALINKLFETP